MGDDETIELVPPLPGLADRATITFMGPRHGLLKRSSPVPRSQADHAVLSVVFNGKYVEESELDLAGVDAYLEKVEDFRATVAARREENEVERVVAEELRATRGERAAAVRPSCPYCGVRREHRGRQNVVTAGRPSELGRPESGLSQTGYVSLELYACPRCGSAEWFETGALDHPLGS